jgi:hypothetical protein
MTFAPSRLIDKLEGEFHLLSLECTIIDASLSSIVAEGASPGQIAFSQKRTIKAPKKRDNHHPLLIGAVREILFSVRIQSIFDKSLSAHSPATGDDLDDDEGNRAQ